MREQIEILQHEKIILDQENNFKKAVQGVKPELNKLMDALRNENLYLSKENSKFRQVLNKYTGNYKS